jgi:hypothetical protein
MMFLKFYLESLQVELEGSLQQMEFFMQMRTKTKNAHSRRRELKKKTINNMLVPLQHSFPITTLTTSMRGREQVTIRSEELSKGKTCLFLRKRLGKKDCL